VPTIQNLNLGLVGRCTLPALRNILKMIRFFVMLGKPEAG